LENKEKLTKFLIGGIIKAAKYPKNLIGEDTQKNTKSLKEVN